MRYLDFCPEFLLMQKNSLIGKLSLVLKFMTLQSRQQIIIKDILSNIARSKGNRTMKFGLLIEYNMRNTFFKELYTNCDVEASFRFFYKKSKLGKIG